jgi:hypothetical protein
MQIVLSKEKKTDFIALLVCWVFFFFLTTWQMHIVSGYILGGVIFFSVLRGMGQPSHSEST